MVQFLHPDSKEVLDHDYLGPARAKLAHPPRALPVSTILDRFRAHAHASQPSRAWLLAVGAVTNISTLGGFLRGLSLNKLSQL